MKIIWKLVKAALAAVGGAVVLIFVTEANWATRPSKAELRKRAEDDLLRKLVTHMASEHDALPRPKTRMEAEVAHFLMHQAGACGHDLSSLEYRTWKATRSPMDIEADRQEMAKIKLHYASEHSGAIYPIDVEAARDIHHHDHFGPCGIRNHPFTDLSYDPEKAAATIAEAEAM